VQLVLPGVGVELEPHCQRDGELRGEGCIAGEVGLAPEDLRHPRRGDHAGVGRGGHVAAEARVAVIRGALPHDRPVMPPLDVRQRLVDEGELPVHHLPVPKHLGVLLQAVHREARTPVHVDAGVLAVAGGVSQPCVRLLAVGPVVHGRIRGPPGLHVLPVRLDQCLLLLLGQDRPRTQGIAGDLAGEVARDAAQWPAVVPGLGVALQPRATVHLGLELVLADHVHIAGLLQRRDWEAVRDLRLPQGGLQRAPYRGYLKVGGVRVDADRVPEAPAARDHGREGRGDEWGDVPLRGQHPVARHAALDDRLAAADLILLLTAHGERHHQTGDAVTVCAQPLVATGRQGLRRGSHRAAAQRISDGDRRGAAVLGDEA